MKRRAGQRKNLKDAPSEMTKGDTVQECLALFGVDLVRLSACGSVCEEWKVIKKAYFKSILDCHPDKGGDASVFRDVQSAFEVMRVLFDSGKMVSFARQGNDATSSSFRDACTAAASSSTPSWEYYNAAAEEVMPLYHVELAKSGRGACSQTGEAKKCCADLPAAGGFKKTKRTKQKKKTSPAATTTKQEDVDVSSASPASTALAPLNPLKPKLIEKGEIRLGSINVQSGTYGHWYMYQH